MVISKKTLQKELEEAWRKWRGAFVLLPEASLSQPETIGNRSIKDVIAHVSWSVIETNGMLAGQALVGSELWRLSEDERNEVVFQQNKDRSISEVIDEANEAHEKLTALIEGISEDDLLHADWFAALAGNFPPSRVIRVNVIDHYLHHAKDIELLAR